MRKLKLLFVLIIASTFFSCQKQENIHPNAENEKIDLSAVKAIASLQSLEEIKVAYGLLNYSERAELWQNHLSEYLNVGLTSQQESKILELKKRISSNDFNLDKDTGIREFIRNWVIEALGIFSLELISELVASPSSVRLNKVNRQYDMFQKDCNCKSINNWLTLCGGYIVVSGTCKRDNCERFTFCGFLFLEDCDGLCKDY
ncbi:bacteriocin fulvocin C-related protein [Sphingobacterium spiritivorum]|uniref:bacteriocin fulvocin C-related protein n=1 Tax=Sphingobacterium spiritivorum TaxID=258 RepID=UPI003DA5F98D